VEGVKFLQVHLTLFDLACGHHNIISHSILSNVSQPLLFVFKYISSWETLTTIVPPTAPSDVPMLTSARGSQKFGGRLGSPHLDGGVGDHVEMCFSPTCVTLPNVVVLGQTIPA